MQESGFNIFTDLQSIAPELKCTKPTKLKHAAPGPRLPHLKSKNAGSNRGNPFKRALGDVSNKLNDGGSRPQSNSKKNIKKDVPPVKLMPLSKTPASETVYKKETPNVIYDGRNETFLPIEICPDINEDDDSWDVLPDDHRFTNEDIYRIVNLRECLKENYTDAPPEGEDEAPLCTLEVPFYHDFKPFAFQGGSEDPGINTSPSKPDFPLDDEEFVGHYIIQSLH